MPFAVICLDKPGALELRKANRDDHVAYLKATGVAQAGPFLNDDGDMMGSLLILNVDTRAEAESWAAGDPYAKAGLFDSVMIQNWNKVIG